MKIKDISNKIKIFIKKYRKYVSENLKELRDPQHLTLDYEVVQYTQEVPEEIMNILKDIIQIFVELCLLLKKASLNAYEKNFLSGIQFINNIMKHTAEDFNITQLLYPYPAINKDCIYLTVKWECINDEDFAREEKNRKYHYKHYVDFLQKKDVVKTVVDIQRIILKYFLS